MIPKTKRVLPVDEGTPAQRRVTRSMSAADPSLELSTDLPSRKRRRVAEVSTQPPRVAALALQPTGAAKVVVRAPGSGELMGIERLDGNPNAEAMRGERLKARCFEIAASLSILDHPGKMGRCLDEQALKLATLVESALSDPDVGSKPVVFKGQRTTLAELIVKEMLIHLSPGSDQIGRCSDASTIEAFGKSGLSDVDFMRGAGKDWLLGVLRKRSVDEALATDPGHRFEDALTKLRFLLGVGSVMWNLMSGAGSKTEQRTNADTLSAWLSEVNPAMKDSDAFLSRFTEFNKKTRNQTFDERISRTRLERVPLVGDQPVENVRHEYERPFQGMIKTRNLEDPEQRRAVEQAATTVGEQRMPRQGAPATDLSRPGTLSDKAAASMPEAFKKAGLQALLDGHRLEHGPGINRWEVKGSHRADAADLGFPSAGAQSGGVCDTLLAMVALNESSLYGNKSLVLPIAAGIASFMNFGGYHTFIECLPITQSVAHNKPLFIPGVDKRHASLYSDFDDMVRKHVGGEAHNQVRQFKTVFDQVSRLNELKPDFEPDKIFVTPEQHRRFRESGGYS